MSAVERKAWMTEALKMAYWWRANATTRQAVPVNPLPTVLEDMPPDTSTSISTSETELTTATTTTDPNTAAPAATKSSSPGGGAAQQPGSSLAGRVAPYLITGLLAGGIPAGVYAWLHNAAPATVGLPTPKDGDLLQYLQSKGDHLPQKWPTK
jgi:hypothetical protein